MNTVHFESQLVFHIHQVQ